jgi:hypothetical protein
MKRWLLVWLLLLCATPLAAQTVTVRATDPSTGVNTNVGDSTNNAFRINCVIGCTSTTMTDRGTFTVSASGIGIFGGFFDDSPPAALTTGMAGAVRLTARRAFHVNLRDASGNEISSWPVTNTGTFAVQAAQSGTWTVQPGNTANTTAWLVTGTGGVFPATQSGAWNITNITGTISLPTGAATAAKQPALGTAGTASADVLTIQGITGMTAVKVDGSAVTQPVSGTVTANAGTGTFSVSCVSGCTPGGSFADSSAFTFGSDAVGNIGAVVDDTSTNTVAENSAGAPRMSTGTSSARIS